MEKTMTKNKFNQLCVLQGCIMPDGGPQELIEFFKKEMGVRVQYENQVKTLPDFEGCTETGGSYDIFFYIHDEDISKFAVPRLQMGIRWWEDVLGNGNGKLYPQHILETYKKTW